MLLLRENFILGLTPSLKTSGMPFSVLPCGCSLSVIRAGCLSEKRYTLSEVCSFCENRNKIILLSANLYGRKTFVLDFCVLKKNIPICLCYLSFGLCPWSNASLCEICRRCVKCVNDMENLPTEDLFFCPVASSRDR